LAVFLKVNCMVYEFSISDVRYIFSLLGHFVYLSKINRR